jgi:hypothetical protein
MEPEQLILIVGALLIGALLVLGGIWAGLRGRRRSKSDRGDLPAAAPGQAPKREPSSWRNEWQRKLPPDVVLLARDAASGEWLVEIEGQRYRRLSDIHDDQAATKIVSAIEGLKTFAGLGLKTSPESSAPQRIGVVSDPGSPLPPSTGPRKSIQATYSAPEGSIIAQIEQILQLELGRHPDLASRSIHMGALPDGSLVVEADGHFYRTPDEIPDAAARDIVLRAVRTWEASS